MSKEPGASAQGKTFKITDGRTVLDIVSPHGITGRQIECIEGQLDVTVVSSGNDPVVLTISCDKKSPDKENNILLAITALHQTLEKNSAKTELSQNAIKRLIKELRTTVLAQKAAKTEALPEAFAAPAGATTAGVNKTLKKIREKTTLTQFQEDGTLLFNPATGEVWTPTPGQTELIAAFPHNAGIVLKGPAGSGKTEFSARMSLDMLMTGETDQIIISAPVDEGGEEIGYRKGTDQEKMNGHINQILEAMDGHLGQGDFKRGQKIREELVDAGIIEITSLGVISGRNLRRKVLIVDEAHKARMPHLLLCLSRVHTDGSKVILMGDERQHMGEGVSDFRAFTKRFADPAYKGLVAQITFKPEDIRRHPLPKLMAERGDDMPPALAQKILDEQMTPEKRAALLRAHFAQSASGKKKPDPLTQRLADELIRRMEPAEVYALLEKQVMGEPGSEPK